MIPVENLDRQDIGSSDLKKLNTSNKSKNFQDALRPVPEGVALVDNSFTRDASNIIPGGFYPNE